MTLSDIAIRRPVFTLMLSLAIVVFGLISYKRLGTELYPPVDFPILLVQTVYPGAPPADIERDVTDPLEDAVAGIAGIQKLQSFTRDSVSVVLVQFDLETDLDAATNAVRDRIGAAAGKLPAAAETPIIKQVDIGALPIIIVSVTSSLSVNATRELVDDRLRPLLEQVEGVGSVNIVGGQDREIQVDLDLDKMAGLGLTPDAIQQRIGIENLSLPVGQFDQTGYAIGVRADGQFKSVEDIRSVVVSQTNDGRTIHLGEVATVTDGFSRATRYVRSNLREAVTLEVIKKSGSNTVEVCDGVREAMAANTAGLGHGATFEVIADQSVEVKANADEVWVAIYFGGAMAVLVILFFLLDLRGTIISSLALPTSIIGTFAMMYAMGFSLNMMTLMGMSLAIGLLIDDAVVVRESITRRLELGDDPYTAASKGTSEIALAVLATTLSLVAVFVPVAFMSGMVGQFFKQFGLTIASAVMLSLWVAFTLDPMLSARFSVRHVHGPRKGIAGYIERILDANDRGYRAVLDFVLRHQVLTVVVTLLTLVGTVGIATQVPQEFVPKGDRGQILADIRLPVGTALEVTDAASRKVEAELMTIPGVDKVYTIVGHEDQTQRSRFRVLLKPREERGPIEDYEIKVREMLETVPQAEASLTQPAIIEGLGDWPPFMYIVQGDDLDGVMAQGKRIRDLIASVPGTADVRLTTEPGRPELMLDIDRALAADRGVPAGLVAVTARGLVEGNLVGTLRDGGPEADIRVRAHPRFTNTVDAMRLLPLPSQRGVIRLGDVASVRMQAGASTINHFARMRSVSVWAQLAPGAALGTVLTEFQAKLDANPMPDGYLLTLDGQAKDMNETASAMGLAIAVAGIMVFMVLASQFESLLHPGTLMISVPLAMVGALLGLFITGSSISMGSQIGIILLMGLVTKNAILLVDGALVHIREGYTPVDAIKAAGPRRLRPILMTSAAMALGMIPTAIGHGVGSEFRSPMAVAVIGGVISSTVLTLLVVPVAFVWMEGLRGRLERIGRWLAPDAYAEAPAHLASEGAAVGEGSEVTESHRAGNPHDDAEITQSRSDMAGK